MEVWNKNFDSILVDTGHTNKDVKLQKILNRTRNFKGKTGNVL